MAEVQLNRKMTDGLLPWLLFPFRKEETSKWKKIRVPFCVVRCVAMVIQINGHSSSIRHQVIVSFNETISNIVTFQMTI